MLENLILLAVVGIFGSGDAGTTAFPLLKVPVSPRACAMGETFTGFADDVNALYWNPAGLGQLSTIQLGLSHQEWFGGIRDENLGLVAPVGPGCLAVGTVYSTTGGIEVWDPTNHRTEQATARSGYATLGYGLNVTRRLGCGLSFKGLYDDLLEQTGSGVCADAGLLYRISRPLRAGLVAQNLGWGMKYGPDNIPLPTGVRAGLSYEQPRFRILFDANAPVDNRPDLHLGGEYILHDVLALRSGFRLGPQDWSTLSLLSGVTFGFGINLSVFSLDYAFVPYGELGMTHRIALRTSLPTRLYGKARIRVSEFKTALPVAAEFKLEGTQQGNSYTETDGTFVVEGIEPGWLKVTASADGYYPATESVLIEPRVTHNVRLVARRSGFGSLWGVVYDADARVPVSSRIGYNGPEQGSTETGKADGSFLIRKLKAGDYDFVITPADSVHKGQTMTITIEPGELSSITFLLGKLSGSAPNEIREAPVPADSTPAPARTDSLPPAPPEQQPAPAGGSGN